MKIYLGSDHRGLALAETLAKWLTEAGQNVVRIKQDENNSQDDYVDFGAEVGRQVAQAVADGEEAVKGVAICGSGVGMDIAANKIKGIRASLGYSSQQVKAARNDDDINVLALGSDFLDTEHAKELTQVFLHTPFGTEERYARRVHKLQALEEER